MTIKDAAVWDDIWGRVSATICLISATEPAQGVLWTDSDIRQLLSTRQGAMELEDEIADVVIFACQCVRR
jgi:hypothetical protein